MRTIQYGMDNARRIIDHYYPSSSPLCDVLLQHSTSVMQRARLIAANHPELGLDTDFLVCAAMVHDIGIVRCHAPAIHCHGTEPYICHGVLGAAMVRDYFTVLPANDLLSGTMSTDVTLAERLARVCERHTGAGITARQIRSQQLPLPERDYLPETIEEQVICYADKFYSKTRLTHEKTLEEAARSLQKFGEEGVQRFLEWQRRFEPTLG